MNQRMMARTLELLEPQPTDRVLDLFCGLGNFSLPVARRVAEVVGVEGEHALVHRAAANADDNGIDNAQFQVANLFDDQRGSEWARMAWDKLLLDPPRAGAEKLLEYLPDKRTRRVVYVSCHPASLARDAGILVNRTASAALGRGDGHVSAHRACRIHRAVRKGRPVMLEK